jgi:general stress protein 26
MPTPQELKENFWKALRADMTLMLGLKDDTHVLPRPMTAQMQGDHGPLWFFTAKDTVLAQALIGRARPALATFTSKGHDLFATVEGQLAIDNDPAMIDALWNRFVAAWFEGGKEDPKLALLRFDLAEAEIWLDASSLVSGIKMLLGADPKEEYRDKVAKVALR